MKLSQRELVLACVTGAVLLTGGTYLLCEPRVKEYRSLIEERRKMQERLALDERLAAQRTSWSERMSQMGRSLPEFPADKDVTADLLITLERIAKEHGISLSRRDAEPEQKRGSICELAINCKYEGTLESLVHFLFELKQQGAMLDVGQLTASPDKGILKGSFVIDCAYRRARSGESNPKPGTQPQERAPQNETQSTHRP